MTDNLPEHPEQVFPQGASEELLAVYLRDEAAADRPAFSPALHRRLVRAWREQSTQGRTVSAPVPGVFSHQRLGMLIAGLGVACLLLISVFGWWMQSPDSSAPGVRPDAPALAIGDPLAEVSLAISLPTRMAVYADGMLAEVWNIPPAARLRDNTRQAVFTLLARLPWDAEAAAEPQVEP